MNKHFEDARYYLGRATEHAKEGIGAELDTVEGRFRELTGAEEEPEPGRLNRVRRGLADPEQCAEGEAKEAVVQAATGSGATAAGTPPNDGPSASRKRLRARRR